MVTITYEGDDPRARLDAEAAIVDAVWRIRERSQRLANFLRHEAYERRRAAYGWLLRRWDDELRLDLKAAWRAAVEPREAEIVDLKRRRAK